MTCVTSGPTWHFLLNVYVSKPILTLQREDGGLHFGNPYVKQPVVLGLNHVHFVNIDVGLKIRINIAMVFL